MFLVDSICSNTDLGLIATLDVTTLSQWTSYSYNYTASTNVPTVFFGFQTDLDHTFYLDEASVVDISTPSIELLNNPNFENSTMNGTEWNEPCNTTCTHGVVSTSQCSGASGNCFKVECPQGNPSVFFLSQQFQAVIGNTYTISFLFNHQGNSTAGSSSFSVNVV